MSSIDRKESFEEVEFEMEPLSDDDLVEPTTLSTKEIERAREEALKVLNTKCPQEALKIFTENSNPKAAAENVETIMPTKVGGEEPKTTVPAPAN